MKCENLQIKDKSSAALEYPSVDGVQVQLGLLGPLLPEVWILQRNVRAVPSCHKASLPTERLAYYRLGALSDEQKAA